MHVRKSNFQRSLAAKNPDVFSDHVYNWLIRYLIPKITLIINIRDLRSGSETNTTREVNLDSVQDFARFVENTKEKYLSIKIFYYHFALSRVSRIDLFRLCFSEISIGEKENPFSNVRLKGISGREYFLPVVTPGL